MALYMVGFITYGATLVFYAAVFPRLARNTPHARDLREKYEIPPDEPATDDGLVELVEGELVDVRPVDRS